MPTQTGSINLKAAKAAADIAKETSQYFWVNSQDSGAGEGAGAHITEVDSDTFISNPSNGGGNVFINSNSVNIRDGVTNLATFGASGATIGQNASGKSRTEIGSAGMQIFQNESGTDKQIVNLGYGSGTNESGGTSDAPYYTFGERTSGGTIGNYSVAEGMATSASNYLSHAEGYFTRASGVASHAEGRGAQVMYVTSYAIQATGTGSHAEGYGENAINNRGVIASGTGAHAEGNAGSGGTVASGSGSHAEGYSTESSGMGSHSEGAHTTASGSASHAQNYYTTAQSDYQTAIGKYNTADINNTYALIIGNGTAHDARSNALTVDWNGNVNIPTGTAYKVGGVSLVDLIYPVGSIYMSVSSTSPATLFGGTWQQIEDTFLLAAGSTYTAGATGGEATVTLQESQLPTISGTAKFNSVQNSSGSGISLQPSAAGHFTRTGLSSTGTSVKGGSQVTGASQSQLEFKFGSGGSHENMPPYLAVYVWKRTA